MNMMMSEGYFVKHVTQQVDGCIRSEYILIIVKIWQRGDIICLLSVPHDAAHTGWDCGQLYSVYTHCIFGKSKNKRSFFIQVVLK